MFNSAAFKSVIHPSLRCAAGAIGTAVGGPVCGAVSSKIGAFFLGKAAVKIATEIVSKGGGGAGQKLLEMAFDTSVASPKSGGALEDAYREALRQSLASLPDRTKASFEDWFENWERSLAAGGTITLPSDSVVLLQPETVDELLVHVLEVLDAQGAQTDKSPLTLRLVCRTLPPPLRAELDALLAHRLEQQLHAIIHLPEYDQGWKELQGFLQKHEASVIAALSGRIDDIGAQTAVLPHMDATLQQVARDLDRLLALPISGVDVLSASAGTAAQREFARCLTLPEKKDDAWNRFAPPVELIGRQSDLDRLNEFFDHPMHFAWQVMFGVNAVGKSRLAQEWLLQRAQANARGIFGFVPEQTSSFDDLLSLMPGEEMALVIDNANEMGDRAFDFIERAAQVWASAPRRVRILLLAHSDLFASSPTFEQAERLRLARENQEVIILQVSQMDGNNFRGPAAQVVPRPGIRLSPLTSESDQAALIQRSAEGAKLSLTDKEVEGIIRLTDGRPALLALAGRQPDTWQSYLREYAEGIVNRTKKDFKDCEEDGLTLLILSVLAGPIEMSVANEIAPRAWQPERVAALFSKDVSAVAEMIPAFEPDLLGQDVAIFALLAIRPDMRQKICDQICRSSPDRSLGKITAAWERKIEEKARHTAPQAGKGASVFTALEILHRAVAAVVPRGIGLPFQRLYLSRARYLAGTLQDAATDQACTSIIRAIFSLPPEDSIVAYLRDIEVELPCTLATRSQWLALVWQYIKAPQAAWPDRLADLKFPSGQQDANQCAALAAGLSSRESLKRVVTAFQVGELLRYRSAAAEPLFADTEVIKRGLLSMVSSPRAVDRIAAGFALTWFVRDSDGSPGMHHLGPEGVQAIYDAFVKPSHPANGLLSLSFVLGFALRSQYAFTEVESWLPDANVVPYGDPRRDEYPLPELAAKVIDVARHYLSKKEVTSNIAWPLALLSLRLGQILPETVSILCRAFDDPIISTESREEVLIRSVRCGGDHWLPVVHAAKQAPDKGVRFLAIAVLMQFGYFDELRGLDDFSTDLPGNLTEQDIFDAASERARLGAWIGETAKTLRGRLADISVARQGHLIHNLKAKDSTDRWVYYFVLVAAQREAEFMAAIEGDGTIDLEDYGKVVASCYGEEPSSELRDLKDRYGFDV